MPFFSFQDQYELAQHITGVSDAASVIRFKRDINTGGSKLMAAMDRPFNRQYRYARLVADQQQYTLAKDVQRPAGIRVLNGSNWVPLVEVPNLEQWRLLNHTTTTGIPTHFFLLSQDELGLWPIPGDSVNNALEITFHPKSLLLSAADFIDGTISATEGDATVTHSGTGFTAVMAGRALEPTDGSDGNWYRVATWTDASNLELDNVYQGVSGSGITFRIGEVMDLPEEYLESPVDYALFRWYTGRDTARADRHERLWKDALADIRADYGKKTAGIVIMKQPPGVPAPMNSIYGQAEINP